MRPQKGAIHLLYLATLPQVVHLSAASHVAASHRDAQPFDGLLREDLPTGIFDADSIVLLQNVDDRFGELGLLPRFLSWTSSSLMLLFRPSLLPFKFCK